MTGVTTSFGSGGDVFLLKFDNIGKLLWARTWGGSNYEEGRGVATDSLGNVYVTGTTYSFGAGQSDAFILKFDSAGNLIWQRTWGGSSSEAGYGISVDSSDSIYVTGYTASAGAGGIDLFLLKLDSSGNMVWQHTWGGLASDSGSAIAINGSRDVYVAGYTNSFGAGKDDALLLKFDSNGNLLWQKTWGGISTDQASGIALDSGGNSIYLAGTTCSYGAGGCDAPILKISVAGNLVWQHTWGGSSDDQASALAVERFTGDIYVTGSTDSYGTAGDVILLKLSPQGSLISQNVWGGQGADSGTAVSVDASGSPVIGGYVSEASPYTLSSGNSTLGTPNFNLSGPSFALGTPSFSLNSPNGAVTTPTSSLTYAGLQDAFLLKYGVIKIDCGQGLSCFIAANATLSTIDLAGKRLSFTLNKDPGHLGFVNVSIPRPTVPPLSQLNVYVNQTQLSDSNKKINMNSTYIAIYFTLSLDSNLSIQVAWGSAASIPSAITTVAVFLVLALFRYVRRTKSRKVLNLL